MIRCAIIDDEPAVAEIIKYFIDKYDMPLEIVGKASDGVSGLSLLKRVAPQLVFLDIQMPLLNGFGVMEGYPDAKYIIVTAFESFGYAQNALRLGAADILLKPIEYSQLEQAVTRAVGWSITGNETVNEIIVYINNHYDEKITLNRLAEHFFLTHSHIARLFKKYTGESTMVYVNRVRINKAKKLLDRGYSVKYVALATGYESLNNFYKHFKRFTGTTPAAYIKKP